MAAGLCSVLKNIRGSMDSDSDSENDHDVTDDVDPPSWHGSMQHLTSHSTSESEAGNCSSESFLCDHCGRPSSSSKGDNNSSNNSNHSRTSGRPPFPTGRKRGVRPKKRAHFAVDTDNSSDNADKMSDSHETSPCSSSFKPISGKGGPSQMVLNTSRRGSLSPREVKPADSPSNRPSQSFTRSTSLSTSSDRGRQPFKANHELFKRPPSGSSSTPSTPSGKPALPPRQINRNHFKLQRRNSISNDERSKLPLQTTGKPADCKHVRSASATREIVSSKSYETKNTYFETKTSEHRVSFASSKPDAVPLRDGNGSDFSDGVSKGEANVRELPNYEEAVQRVSLLRWASLQKLPRKSSSGENLLPSPTKDFSPTTEFKNFIDSPQTSTPTNSSPAANVRVGDRVRCFEAKAVSFSSGSNSSSLTAERSSSSWNPSLSSSLNSGSRKSDWLRNSGVNNHHNNYSKDEEHTVENNRGMNNVINNSTRIASNNSHSNDCHSENGSVFRLRRDDSSTLSDDVFAHDDSRENFADISWSPVILTEDNNKSSEKNAFLSVPPRPPKPSATANFLAPPLPTSRSHNKSRLDTNAPGGLMQSGSNDHHHHHNNSNNTTNRTRHGTDNSNSTKNNNSLGDNNNNNNNNNNSPPSLSNGKRIVLEVLV